MATPDSYDARDPELSAPARLVRSYTITAGRTRARVDLPMEATLRRQGFEDEGGEVQVWELPAAKFRAAMYDSRSTAASGGRAKMVAKGYALREGRPIARFTRLELATGAPA